MKIYICNTDETERNKIEICGEKEELISFSDRVRESIECEADKVGGIIEIRTTNSPISDVVVINISGKKCAKEKSNKDIIIAAAIILVCLIVIIAAFAIPK
jgi:hypothetical protein